jgi:hypothetical protein
MPDQNSNLPPMHTSERDPSGLPPKKRRYGALIFVTIVVLFFGWIAISVNFPKERPAAEPLPERVRGWLEKSPVHANVIFYANLTHIRQTDFWKTFLPDSVKNGNAFSNTKSDSLFKTFSAATGFQFLRDADELLYAAVHDFQGERGLALVTGTFDSLKTTLALKASAKETQTASARTIQRVDSAVWVCYAEKNLMLVSPQPDLIKNFLEPKTSFFKSDTLMAPLIERVEYKSQAWLVLGSTTWALEAMKGITAQNEGLMNSGNVSKIRQMLLSAKLTDGMELQTEWIYGSKTSAYFARGLVGFSTWIGAKFSQRQNESIKKVLEKMDVEQNLESVIVRVPLSRSFLDEVKQKKIFK